MILLLLVVGSPVWHQPVSVHGWTHNFEASGLVVSPACPSFEFQASKLGQNRYPSGQVPAPMQTGLQVR